MESLKEKEGRWDGIGKCLYVPYDTRHHIKSQHSTDSDQLREVFLYVMGLHPFSGWRMIIDALHWIKEDQLATEIHDYAEPLTGMYDHQRHCCHMLQLLYSIAVMYFTG